MAAPDELPNFREKRDILFGDATTDETMRQTGKQFMNAEQYYDALEFFARCDAEEYVRDIAELAFEKGNTALFLRAKVVLEEKADPDVLMTMAENAQKTERPSMARVAYQKAGQEDKAEEITENILKGEEPEKAPQTGPANDES